jgi:hypothetical protein
MDRECVTVRARIFSGTWAEKSLSVQGVQSRQRREFCESAVGLAPPAPPLLQKQ